jgi:RimJ/RimL family protein N-acetyltransferase
LWLYARFHHITRSTLLGSIDCGTWSKREATSVCFSAFEQAERLYAVSAIAATCAAVYLVAYIAICLRRPSAVARHGNVLLRPAGPRDAKAFAGTIDATVIVENRMPFDAARRTIFLARWLKFPNHLMTCDVDHGSIVGVLTVTHDTEASHATLGIWTAGPHRGRGYGTGAVHAVVELLGAQGIRTVVGETAIDNRAMQAVLSKAGFTTVDKVSHTLPNGDVLPALRFSLTNPDLPAPFLS